MTAFNRVLQAIAAWEPPLGGTVIEVAVAVAPRRDPADTSERVSCRAVVRAGVDEANVAVSYPVAATFPVLVVQAIDFDRYAHNALSDDFHRQWAIARERRRGVAAGSAG